METSKGGNYAHPVIQKNPKEMMEEQNYIPAPTYEYVN